MRGVEVKSSLKEGWRGRELGDTARALCQPRTLMRYKRSVMLTEWGKSAGTVSGQCRRAVKSVSFGSGIFETGGLGRVTS